MVHFFLKVSMEVWMFVTFEVELSAGIFALNMDPKYFAFTVECARIDGWV